MGEQRFIAIKQIDLKGKGKMPNPGKSLSELRRSGTLKAHPGRYRQRLTAADGFVPLGDPPAHLSQAEAIAWNEIRDKAAPGTVSEGDFMIVELAARLLVQSREDWANFSATNKRILQSLASDLGMSPMKRGKIPTAQEESKEESGLAALARILNGSDPHERNARTANA